MRQKQTSLRIITVLVFTFAVLFYAFEDVKAQSPPNGPAGGDLAGTYPNPSLATDRVRKVGDTMTGAMNISMPTGDAVITPFSISGFGNAGLNRGVAFRFNLGAGGSNSAFAAQIVAAREGPDPPTYLSFGTHNGTAVNEALRITSSGRLGIGTTAPANQLHINNASAAAALLVAGSSGGMLSVQDTAAAANSKLYQWRSEGGVFRMALINDAWNNFVQQNLLVATSSGNIGVGNATPAFKLDVSGEINATGLRINGAPIATGGSSQWTTGSSNIYYMSNVGIGTSTPSLAAKLDVAGVIRGTGFKFPDDTVQTTAGSVNIFKNVANAAGTSQFSATSNNDSIRFEGAGGTNVTFDALNKKVVITGGGSGTSGWTAVGSTTVGVTSLSARVGIGTDSPAGGLDVQNPVTTTAGVAHGVRLQQSLTAATNSAELNGLSINTSFVDGLATGVRHNALVTAAGNIGFGTTVTGAGLDVQNSGVPLGSSTFGARFQQSLPSSGNGSVSTAVYINPTFSDGAAVNVKHNGLVVAAGNVGIGTSEPSAKLHVVGNGTFEGNLNATGDFNASGTITGGTIIAKYQDVAEWVPSTQELSAGTVVVLDQERSNHVLASSHTYDTRVAGVVSAQPGMIMGEGGPGKLMVATTGRVRMKVDATCSPIRIGDLLVTGAGEGIAMKSLPIDLSGTPIHRPGTIIGKALEPLEKGTGEILVLLSLQ